MILLDLYLGIALKALLLWIVITMLFIQPKEGEDKDE